MDPGERVTTPPIFLSPARRMAHRAAAASPPVSASAAIDQPRVIRIRDKAYKKRKRRFANYVIQVLSLLFTWGIPRRYLAINPALGVPKIRRPRTAKKVNRAWTVEEVWTVLDAATGGLKRAIALGAFGVCREGDAIRFARHSYNGREIRFTARKNGEEIWMPAPAPLRRILNEAPEKGILLTANRWGKPYTESGFRASFFKLVRKLEGQEKVQPGLTFHGLRHTGGKLLREAGMSDADIQAMLGDRSPAMARHYSDEADKTIRRRAAIVKLERAMNRGCKTGVAKPRKNAGGGVR
jgi:integrase